MIHSLPDIGPALSRIARILRIGGEGDDQIKDNSHVTGLEKKTLVYDTKQGNELISGSETKDLRSSDLMVNSYNRKDFKYDV